MGHLNLDETDQRRFRHGARGYGAEVYGGEPKEREQVLDNQLGEPIVKVDARDIDTADEIAVEALVQLSSDREEIEKRRRVGSHEIVRELGKNGSNLAILEFDSLDYEEQKATARMMKAVAETLDDDDVLLGYACEEGGAVVRAEHDLSMRVRSWEIE